MLAKIVVRLQDGTTYELEVQDYHCTEEDRRN